MSDDQKFRGTPIVDPYQSMARDNGNGPDPNDPVERVLEQMDKADIQVTWIRREGLWNGVKFTWEDDPDA